MSRNTGLTRFKRKLSNLICMGHTKMPADREEVLRSLGRVIRQARKGKKMTQEDLSEIAGVNAKYLGEVELGKTNPTITLLIKLSWALGMEIDDIFYTRDGARPGASTIYGEIAVLVRKLDLPALHKLHKILKLVTE